MAKRVIHLLEDDLEGGKATQTLRFTFGGHTYELDLNDANAEEMRQVFGRYMEAGTRVNVLGARHTRSPRTSSGSQPAAPDRTENAAIREWAQDAKVAVAPRGRIRQEIIDRYRAEKAAGNGKATGAAPVATTAELFAAPAPVSAKQATAPARDTTGYTRTEIAPQQRRARKSAPAKKTASAKKALARK